MQAQDIFMICSMTSNTSMMGHLWILSIYNFKLVIANKMSNGLEMCLSHQTGKFTIVLFKALLSFILTLLQSILTQTFQFVDLN